MLFLAIAVAAGFLTTFFLTPQAIQFLRSSGIVGIDQQKADRPTLPTSGGIAVIFGFLVSLSTYIGMTTFVPGAAPIDMTLVLAALSATLVIGLIGLIDDIHVKQEAVEAKQEEQVRIGLAQKYKYGAPVIAALPLMAVKAGTSTMTIPLVGAVAFGVLYPLVLVPVAITCVVNATNMLAGQNGLETSLGAIALAGLGTFAYLNGAVEGALIAYGMALPLLAFLYYNRCPARILPGDSLTYATGAAYISATIIANMELFAVVVFLPWIAEAFLKLRSKFQASSLGELQADGTLAPKHDRIYSLTHILMRFDLTERQLVMVAAGGELLLVVAALILFT